MKFLVDECTGILVSQKLKELKYDSISVIELNDLFSEIDEQNKGKRQPKEQKILGEIQAKRALKRGKQGA